VVCQFKGRENAYPELGRQQMDAISGALAEISSVEGPINKQGRDMTMMIAPKAGLKPLPKPVKDNGKGKGAEQPAEEVQSAEDAEFEAMQARLAEEADDSGEEVDGDTESVEVGDADIDEVGETDDLSDDAEEADGDSLSWTSQNNEPRLRK
jgi:hypothetical protein